MSNAVAFTKSVVVTVLALVLATNEKSIQVRRKRPDGQDESVWIDYGTTFQGEKLTDEAVGLKVELALVESRKDHKQYVRAAKVVTEAGLELTGEEAGQDTPPTTASAPGESQVKFAKDLAAERKIPMERLDLLCSIRFGQPFKGLAKAEMSKLIDFLSNRPKSMRAAR